MTHDDWKDAAAGLAARAAAADSAQEQLARKVGLSLPRRVPALVAAALLREHLAGPLRTDAPASPSHGQLEYITDLVRDVKAARPKPIETRMQASAWIDVLEARRAAQALKRLRPACGDVVASTLNEDVIGLVASISDNGRINLAGPGGRSLRPHRAEVLARAGTRSAAAEDARRRARNQAALRSKPTGPPSDAKMAVLAPYRVDGFADDAEVALLQDAIETAADERPIQTCLASYPRLLAGLIGLTSFGAYVRSQPALGSQLVPDFLLAVADSAGTHWTLIELESPKAQVSTKNGRLADKARQGVQQIEDWREWLLANLDYARRPPDESGLGLVEIRPESPGIVIIGRREDPNVSLDVRQGLIERRNIAVHSYDWLLEAVRPRSNRPGGPLDWADWRTRL